MYTLSKSAIGGFNSRSSYRRTLSLAFALAMAWLLCPGALAATDGEKLYQEQCTPCHTIGGGKLVGPDLQGVTSRRETAWLRRQIKEPDQLIAEEDLIAMQLLEESNNVPMAPLGLNDAQVIAIIEYLESTEQQTEVHSGLPAKYLPTVFISLAILVVLTLVGLKVGSKTVDVR